MHTHDLTLWQHTLDFGARAERIAERRTRWVEALTLVAMAVELTAGWLTGSMALLTDAWHMGTHAAALGISAFAYGRRRREGTGDSPSEPESSSRWPAIPAPCCSPAYRASCT